MAGFVVLYQDNSSPSEQEDDFRKLLEATARFKGLELPADQAVGVNCTAAKLDAPPTLHRGIIRDDSTGSWLLAAGTVVALQGNNDPHGLLLDLLQGYLEEGVKVLDRYDGHFGLVIYNGRDGSLSILSDPMGLFAVYYARREGQVFISTSALAVAQQVGSKADDLIIECFLRAGRVHGEKTFWQDVKRLRPATLIKITPDKFEESEYWQPEIDTQIARLSLHEAIEIADQKIKKVYELIFLRENPVWADFTGGFDTRVTTMYLAKMGIPFTAYCVGLEGHTDIEVSKEICAKLGWDYRHMQLPENWIQEQISWIPKAVNQGDGQLNVVQLAETLRISFDRSIYNVTYVSGLGVDEWRYHIYGSKTFINNVNTKVDYDDILDARLVFPIPISAMKNNLTSEVRNELLNHILRIESRFKDKPVLTRADLIFIRHHHPIHGGAYMSAQSMYGRGLLPFCFKELENYGFSLRHSWRWIYQYTFIRNLLEYGNPVLAMMNTASGEPAMPIRLSNVDKFIPLWKKLINLISKKASRNLFGKSISIFPTNAYPSYPLKEWTNAKYNWAMFEGLLDPDRMISGSLYNPAGMKTLVEQSSQGLVNPGEFLDRVITVEMSLRATGAEVEQG